MPKIYLEDPADEEGTFKVAFAFFDDNGEAFAVNTAAKWTLTTPKGDVVNDKEDVPITIASPYTSVEISLYALDLAFSEPYSDRETRVLTLQATFNDGTNSTAPFPVEAWFTILNRVKIPAALAPPAGEP